MNRNSRSIIFILVMVIILSAKAQVEWLVPKPNSVTVLEGNFVVSSKTAIKLISPIDANYFNLIRTHFEKQRKSSWQIQIQPLEISLQWNA